MSEWLEQGREPGRIRHVWPARQREPLQYLLSPERRHHDQQLKVQPNRVGKAGPVQQFPALFVRELAHANRSAPCLDDVIGNRDILDEHVEHSLLPRWRQSWKHRSEPERAQELSQL